ncbi:MAG: hypothetical protein WC205_04105 [Opitutaceae bacterium]
MIYSEPLVARVTGLSKSLIVGKRKASLVKGADWDVDRNTVCYTEAGLKKLLGALGLSGAVLAWPAEGEGQVGGSDEEPEGEASDGAGEAVAQPPQPGPVVEKLAVGPTCPPPAVGLPGVLIEEATADTVAKAVAKIQDADLVELTVKKISFNPTILHAAGADGVVVTVRVTSNANFLPGMKLKARPPVKGAVQVYSMVGHCPRWRGRF